MISQCLRIRNGTSSSRYPNCLRNRQVLIEISNTVKQAKARKFGHSTSSSLPLSRLARVIMPKCLMGFNHVIG